MLLKSFDYFSYFSVIYLASFILWTPFKSYSLHWSMVLAEFSKEVEYSGNFLVFKYKDNFLSKFDFYLAENCLFISVISETSVSKDCNFVMRSYFYFLTSSSFYSAFFLNYTYKLAIFYSISFLFSLRVSFYFYISSLYCWKVVIFY